MFNTTKKNVEDQAVVVRQRGANIATEHLKKAFGEDVIIVDTDANVRNGFEYIGTFAPPKE